MNLSNKILMTLKHEKDTISLSDFNVIPTYFYNTINALMKENLIESIKHPTDARKRVYKLTKTGHAQVKKIKGFFLSK